MTWREKLRGFYAVLDSADEALARLLVAPDGAGATVLQLRIKPHIPVTTGELMIAARLARRVTRAASALLIVDDRIDVAVAVEADGVHLGQRDLPLADAKRLVTRLCCPHPFLVGVSTHNSVQVVEAVRGGADYLGFGPLYSTLTKENPDPVQGIQGLVAAVAVADEIPIVGIGGVTPDRAAEIADAGASAACSIGAVNQSRDPAATGRRIGAAWCSLSEEPY